MSLALDHVIYAVADLDEGADRFLDEFGLASVAGGRHPGFGTANRIVPLGSEYIELIAVVEPEEARRRAFGQIIQDSAAAGGGWVGYALRTARLDDHADGADIVEMSRRKPDGTLLNWRVGRLADMAGARRWPFLIQWGVTDDQLPGMTAVEHEVVATGISWLEVGGEIPPYASGLDIRPIDGPPGLARVGIGLDSGELVI